MGMYSLSLLEAQLATQPLTLCIDSRKVTPGCVFVALSGTNADGAQFIEEAVAKGARYIVCRPEHAALCEPAEIVSCAEPRVALGLLARARYGTGHAGLSVVGITGTNGKTTTTSLLDHLFTSLGKRTGVLGTVAYRWPGHLEDAPLTTPDCLELHAMLHAMKQADVEQVFMEVSSHALDQHRVCGIDFSGAVFTHLTQDHLDYHGDMETYFRAKSRLFLDDSGQSIPNRVKVIGTDNPWGLRLARQLPDAVGFGLSERPEGLERYMQGTLLSSTPEGLRLHVQYGEQAWTLSSPLVGQYNAENLLAVQALAVEFGVDPSAFRCFEAFYGVSGRLERVANPQGHAVFVDYAHTPDALVNVLQALRAAGFARIVTVFGCGGNRDRTKRPLMGEAVAQWSDVAVLTSDNPRNEDPEAIMADVMPGLREAKEVITESDRRKAIEAALALLRPGDALLVAGKGHERTQQIGEVKHPFSDQETIRELLGCA